MGWRHNELDKWTYYDDNTNEQKLGWQQIDGEYYYLYSDDIAKGWFKDKSDSNWYYFAPSKQVIDGKQWYKGQMLHGVWLDYKNKWYYFNEESGYGGFYKGQMIHSCTYTTPYGKTYQFDDEGVLIENNSLVSDACIDFIKSWEGYYAKPYYDCVGVKTLGYGMTGEEIEGIDYVTEEQATQMLKDWIDKKYAPPIKKDLDSKGVTLKSNEFDSLISFCYNCGVGALLGSTLYKNICNGVRDKNTIISNFTAWSNGGGHRIEGLYRRRCKEANMFLYGDYTGNN